MPIVVMHSGRDTHFWSTLHICKIIISKIISICALNGQMNELPTLIISMDNFLIAGDKKGPATYSWSAALF